MTWDGSVGPVAGASAGVTTSAGGSFTLTHNLGYIPTWLSVETNNSGYVARADLTTCTTSTVTVFVRNISTGGGVAASAATGAYRWLAYP